MFESDGHFKDKEDKKETGNDMLAAIKQLQT